MNFLDIIHSSTETLAGRLRVLACSSLLAAHREQEADAILREIEQRQPVERIDGDHVFGFDDDGRVTCTSVEFHGYAWAPIGYGATAEAAQRDFEDAAHDWRN